MKNKDESLMEQEVFSTFLATSLLISLGGFQAASRETIDGSVRKIVEILFLSIAVFVILWAMLSFYNILNYFLHRLGLFIIGLSMLGSFCYLIFLTAQRDV
jgi:sorbitol-specific phosphotransferase system component IIBC